MRHHIFVDSKNNKAFPIMTGDPSKKEYIPLELIKTHERQALRNHGQNLDTLAQRGGISWSEAFAILNDISYPSREEYVSEEYYKEKVKEIWDHRYSEDTEYCKWESAGGICDNTRFAVQCNHNPLQWGEVPNNFAYSKFKYCPFCGRKITWI